VCLIICLWSLISRFRDFQLPVVSGGGAETCRRVGDGACRRSSIVLVLVFPFSVRRRGNISVAGRNVSACFNRARPRRRRRLLPPRAERPNGHDDDEDDPSLWQSAFDRQRSTIKLSTSTSAIGEDAQPSKLTLTTAPDPALATMETSVGDRSNLGHSRLPFCRTHDYHRALFRRTGWHAECV
jgi:hypothetical protein